MSQLALALEAETTARHVSFLETGRSRPSEEMVIRLSEVLDVPIRDRNRLLEGAGLPPAYPEVDLHSADLEPTEQRWSDCSTRTSRIRPW